MYDNLQLVKIAMLENRRIKKKGGGGGSGPVGLAKWMGGGDRHDLAQGKWTNTFYIIE